MTIERLEALAAYLYKEAEEATPIIGGADKKDWMARRLEEIVEEKEPALNDYLNCETTDEVMGLLETEYQDFKDADDLEEQADMAEADGWDVRPGDRVVATDDIIRDKDDVIIDRDEVVDATYGPDDVVVDEEEIFVEQGEPVISDKTVTTSEKAPFDEKKTGIKEELPDPYVDDRPAQPEFIGNDPEYFDEPAIIVEEEIIIVNDIEDDRNDSSTDQKDHSPDSPKGCSAR